MTGRIEAAIRRAVHAGEVLRTAARGTPFVVEELGADGLTLGLGKKRWKTITPWAVIESIPAFLRGRGWVKVGAAHTREAAPGTLDGFLKSSEYRYRPASSYLPVILERAGAIEIERGRPLRVRLRDDWGSG